MTRIPTKLLPVPAPAPAATSAAAAPADTDPEAAWSTPSALAGLPSLMVEFAQVAGIEAAWRIFEERGGNRAYIPARAGDDHWLVRLAGREAADKLCAHFGGIWLELPRGPTGLKAYVARRLREMIAEGRTSTEITRALGISRDTVKFHRRKAREEADSPQLDLFAAAAERPPPSAPALPPPPAPRITQQLKRST